MNNNYKRVLLTLIILVIPLIIFNIIKSKNTSADIYKKIAPKGSVISKNQFINDLKLLSEAENLETVSVENIFFDPEPFLKNDFEKYKREFIFKEDKAEVGIFLGSMMSKDIQNGIKQPFEVRFAVRTMLYLKERVYGDDFKSFGALYGEVRRRELPATIAFTDLGRIPFKMSLNEFDEIYSNTTLDDLTIEKQVDILSRKWIEKTMYFRTNLNGDLERPLLGLSPKEKLYLILRDVYYGMESGGATTAQKILDLYEKENAEKYLSENEKSFFKVFYESSKKISANSSMGGIAYPKLLDEMFFGKSLSDTVKIFKN